MKLVFQYTKEEYVKSRREYLFMAKIMTKLSVAAIPIMFFLEGILIRQWDGKSIQSCGKINPFFI